MSVRDRLLEAVKKTPGNPDFRHALADEYDSSGDHAQAERWRRVSAGLYPELAEYEQFYGPSDYTPIIEYLGTVLIRVDQNDYQGSTWVLLKDGKRYGFLTFGWGSCSGCDSLQSCETLEDIDGVVKDLTASVKWFDTLAETKAYIQAEIGSEGYRSDDDEWREFGRQVAAYMENT